MDSDTVENNVFPIDNLPYPAYRAVIKHLTLGDVHNFMLASKNHYRMVGRMLLVQWKIPIVSVWGNRPPSVLERLETAKERLNLFPRRLEMKFEINCCRHLRKPWMYLNQDPKELGFTFDCLNMKQSIFQDWGQNITSLKMEILGNETFLMNPEFTCPNLESLSFEIYHYPEKKTDSTFMIIQAVIENHSHNLKRLDVIGYYNSIRNLETPLSLPMLTSCKLSKLTLQSLCNVLVSAHETLNSLEIENPRHGNYFLNLDHKYNNLKHLLLHTSLYDTEPTFEALIQHLSAQLVTLKFGGNNFFFGSDHSYLARCSNFHEIKMLWISRGFRLQFLGKFTDTEILLAFEIYNHEESAVRMPKLRELVVEELCPWSLEMIRLSAETLEVLMVMKPEANYQLVLHDLPKLKQFHMMECRNPDLVDYMRTRCPSSCLFITDHKEAYKLMMEQAKTYPYPPIADKFCEYNCMIKDQYGFLEDESSDDDYDDFSNPDYL